MRGEKTENSDLSFGPFRLLPKERLLEKNGVALQIGGRALDLLILLTTRPGEVVSKRELIARVWADATVDEGSLRFHIAALRKVLGDGISGTRYVVNVPGRGYCFTAPISGSNTPLMAAPAFSLPAKSAKVIGRAETIKEILRELALHRFVTIVGPGGIGKTTVAVAAGHDLLETFAGGVLFADLGTLSKPDIVASYLASMLGLSVQSDDPTPSVTAYLRDKHMLLILDNCEHLIESAAKLAAGIFMAAPRVHILATTREALRVDNEWIHRMSPLAFPSDDSGLTAAASLAFPAIQLFVEHAVANGAPLEFGDGDVPIVAGICRKLDGVPLSIDLAARRVTAYGLRQTAALLDQRQTLQWPGKRTAPPRQKSLNATLEWSYRLLSGEERVVLRRLAVFVGHFTLEAAQAVAVGATIDRVGALSAIESLIDKSMVATMPINATMRYRLLDTTRAFVLETETDTGEVSELATRHATYYQQWLEQTADTWATLPNAAQRTSHLAHLANVRAALEWCFGDDGNTEIGIDLATAAAPIFFAMSLLTDCQRWSRRAILALGEASLGGRKEMRLQAALGLSLMWTQGEAESEATFSAMNRSIAIADEMGEPLNQILLFTPLHVIHLNIGEFRTAQKYAERIAALSRTVEDPTAIALSHILTGFSRHHAGDLSGARRALEAALGLRLDEKTSHEPWGSRSVTIKDDAMATPILALAWSAAPSALSRTLWLQGHPAGALEHLSQTIRDTAGVEHVVTRVVALIYAISVLLWNGDLDDAEEQIARLFSHAESYSLNLYARLGHCFQGQLDISRGKPASGIELLQACLRDLRAVRYELHTTAFNISLVQGYEAIGRFTDGIALVNETTRLAEVNGNLCYMPELLRVKAGLLLAMPQPMEDEAEACLKQSLELSRSQGARAWELRTSIDLAARLAAQGRPDRARALLEPVFAQFSEGSKSADLRTAKQLLAMWD